MDSKMSLHRKFVRRHHAQPRQLSFLDLLADVERVDYASPIVRHLARRHGLTLARAAVVAALAGIGGRE